MSDLHVLVVDSEHEMHPQQRKSERHRRIRLMSNSKRVSITRFVGLVRMQRPCQKALRLAVKSDF